MKAIKIHEFGGPEVMKLEDIERPVPAVQAAAKPHHPLINVFKAESVESLKLSEPTSWCYDFYCIGLKRVANVKESTDSKRMTMMRISCRLYRLTKC